MQQQDVFSCLPVIGSSNHIASELLFGVGSAPYPQAYLAAETLSLVVFVAVAAEVLLLVAVPLRLLLVLWTPPK